MFELLKAYEAIANGLVDIYRILTEKGGSNEVSDLLACSMNIKQCVDRMESADNQSAIANAVNDAIIEIGACEFMITAYIQSGLVPKERVERVIQECTALRNLINSKQGVSV